ncbi:MAG: DeoR family transcriptional regulator, partial [Planctomycetes bacterium]|nr:DeoR family transcriptional regulator [Planctomycetota bacterium]
MSKTDVRRQKIIEILQRERAKGLVELAGILGVSYMTIRRDMKEMESAGKVSVINGVGVLASDLHFSNDRPYSLAVAGSEMGDA